jgi:hypothetical protein
MIKVFLVIKEVRFQGPSVHDIFSTREMAEECANEQDDKNPLKQYEGYIEFRVEEWEVKS